MSFDESGFMRILQIIITTAAATGAIIGAVKFFLKYIDNKLEDKIEDHDSAINKRIDETDHKLSLLQQSMEFFEKYFVEPIRKRNRQRKEEDEPE